jgi:hypothetical protein
MQVNKIMSFLVVFAVLTASVDAFAKRRVLVYTGQLLDEGARPIGGVFPLTFAFYNKRRGGKALWSETHFVAVDDGNYMVDLGRQTKIQPSIDLGKLYVGVRVAKGPELVRERFVAEGSEPEEVIRHQTSKQGGKVPQGGTVDYAEKAGFAYVAEKADSAVRLDGLTLDQLKKALGNKEGGGGGKVTIGTKTFEGDNIGGQGGTPFRQLCPEGYIMTGIQGGSGLYIDRMSIICSPLETKKSKK